MNLSLNKSPEEKKLQAHKDKDKKSDIDSSWKIYILQQSKIKNKLITPKGWGKACKTEASQFMLQNGIRSVG